MFYIFSLFFIIFFLQSLKKEIDWDRHDDKLIGESSSDFRHPHDSVSLNKHFLNIFFCR